MQQHSPKIWLLGASFETGNMGVNALAESSIKCIFTRWPNAKVTLQTREDGMPLTFTFNGQDFSVTKKNIGFRRNLFKTQNAYTLIGYVLLLKVIPSLWLKNKLKARNPYFKDIMEIDLVADITAGDSFSDIYGMRILRKHSLMKWLFILCGNKFIMLPQTYGPFKSRRSKMIARYLLARTAAIYSRDKQGVECVKKLLGKTVSKANIQFIPDVAFVLDPSKHDNPLIERLQNAKADGKIIIGLNISGLLYNGGLAATRQFGFTNDYQKLLFKIIAMFLENPATIIVLIPHVYAPNTRIESDPNACHKVRQLIANDCSERVLMVENRLDHKQLKYLIGFSDFFMGSRMHSCIAAISQYVPTVGIAYSQKFIGVFDSVGVGNSVVDLRTETEAQVLAQVRNVFEKRYEITEKLRETVPKIQEKVLTLFDEMMLKID